MEFYSTAHFPRTVELENQRSEWVYIPAIRHAKMKMFPVEMHMHLDNERL